MVFDYIWEQIDLSYPLFEGLGAGWDEIYHRYRDATAEIQSYGEYASIMTRMGYALEDAHAIILPDRLFGKKGSLETGLMFNITLPKAPVFILGPISKIGACLTVTTDEELVVYDVWENSPNPYNLKVGDEIIGFNGVSWEAWIPRLEGSNIPIVSQPAGAETARRYDQLRSAMGNAHLFEAINLRRVGSDEVETMKVVPLDPNEWASCREPIARGGLVAVKDPDQPIVFEDNSAFLYGIIAEENVGYVYIQYSLSGSSDLASDPKAQAMAEEFENTILALMDTNGLIFDFREYIGGTSIEIFYPGLAHLLSGTQDRHIIDTAVRDPAGDDREQLISTTQAWGEMDCSTITAEDWFRKLCENYPNAFGSGIGPFPADNPDMHYDKPIIVLTGPACTSACDWFVQFLSTFPKITILGRDPNGSLSAVVDGFRETRFGSGPEHLYMQIPKVAFYLVNEGVGEHLSRKTGVVDEEIWFTKEDLVNGVDTVRAYALQRIHKINAGSP
jgi:hypothetical protein